LDIRPEEILFKIDKSSRSVNILKLPFTGYNQSISQFSLDDIKQRKVSLQPIFGRFSSKHPENKIAFLVKAGFLKTPGSLVLDFLDHQADFSSGHVTLKSLDIVKSRNVSLSKGGITTIQTEHLKVTPYPDLPIISDLVKYTVIRRPDYGSLIVDKDQSSSIINFTQQDIDFGKVQYIHDETLEKFPKNQSIIIDRVMLHMTYNRSIHRTFNLPIYILNINDNLHLDDFDVSNLTCPRNGSTVFPPDTVLFKSDVSAQFLQQQDDHDVMFVIVNHPRYGMVTVKDNFGSISNFSLAQLKQGHIAYVHRGDFVDTDWLSITVRLKPTNGDEEKFDNVPDYQQTPKIIYIGIRQQNVRGKC